MAGRVLRWRSIPFLKAHPSVVFRDRPQEELSSVKNTIPLKEITSNIRDGIPDEELMKKYGLSEKGLKRVFESLLKAACDGSRREDIECEE